MPIAAVAMPGAATPALAYDSDDLLSMQQALDIATSLGMIAVSDTEFAGNEWQIEGRDITGRYIEVDVDATTGAVSNVDHRATKPQLRVFRPVETPVNVRLASSSLPRRVTPRLGERGC